jgi:hypothetical protein
MKRRNRILLLWTLTAIWLCVQSPWAHAARLQVHSASHEAAAMANMDADAPCHGEEHSPAPAKSDPCCADGHCDGQCAQLSPALAAVAPQLMVRGAMPPTPIHVARLRSMRQPELFRPPI